MGLDILALPLSRYWSGQYPTVMEQFAARSGLPAPKTIRLAGGAEPRKLSPPPRTYQEWVVQDAESMAAWREARWFWQSRTPPLLGTFRPLLAIAEALGRSHADGVPWDEYDWTRLAGEQLVWERLSALTEYTRSRSHGAERFRHFLAVADNVGCWLPGTGGQLLDLDQATIGLDRGRFRPPRLVLGSLETLLGELDELNGEWKLARDWGELAEGERLAEEDDPEVAAKVGWAIVRSVARAGRRLGCPVILDG